MAEDTLQWVTAMQFKLFTIFKNTVQRKGKCRDLTCNWKLIGSA